MVRGFLEDQEDEKEEDRRDVSCALECSRVLRVIKHFSIEAEIRLRGATPFVSRLFALRAGLEEIVGSIFPFDSSWRSMWSRLSHLPS
jgi:hypothetical protein